MTFGFRHEESSTNPYDVESIRFQNTVAIVGLAGPGIVWSDLLSQKAYQSQFLSEERGFRLLYQSQRKPRRVDRDLGQSLEGL
jgi:hypothetical protein